MNELLTHAGRQQGKMGEGARQASGFWGKIEKSAKDFAHHVTSATEKLLKWSAITGAVGALAGIGGGLFGLERLASSTYSGARSAAGLGLPLGAQRAFNINLGRIVDPNQFLGGVATGLSDFTSDQYRALLGLGLNPQQFADTGEAAIAALPRIQRLLQSRPREQLGSTLRTYGLSSLISEDRARALAATSPSDLGEFIKQFRRDRETLALPADVQKKWADLSVQLQRAGVQIETVLVRGLYKLAPDLDRLSKAFVAAVSAFIKSPEVKKWIDLAATGLEKFANYVSKPEFAQNVEKFISGIGQLANQIFAVVQKISDRLGSLTGGGIGKSAGIGALIGGAVGLSFGGIPGAFVGAGIGAGAGAWAGGLGSTGDEWLKSVRKNRAGEAPPLPRPQDFFPWLRSHLSFGGSAEAAELPGGALQRIREVTGKLQALGRSPIEASGIAANLYAESGLDPTRQGDYGQAFGVAQWHPDRQAEFQRVFGHSIRQSTLDEQLQFVDYELKHGERAAGALLSMARSSSEVAAAFSGYDERPRDVLGQISARAGIAQSIDRALSRTQVATAQHNRRISRDERHRGRMSLDIRNNTGGSAVITGSAIAASYG